MDFVENQKKKKLRYQQNRPFASTHIHAYVKQHFIPSSSKINIDRN